MIFSGFEPGVSGEAILDEGAAKLAGEYGDVQTKR